MGSLGGYLGQLLGHFWHYFGCMMVALDHFWVMLGSLWAHDAYVWGLGGAKSGNVEIPLVFVCFC